MRVAALQLDVQKGAVEENLAAVEAGLARAAEEGHALVVLPEMWPSSFAPLGEDGGAALLAATAEALERVRALSAALELVVCGSAFAPAEGARPRNRLHVFARGAALPGYDKVHLFSPTAERELFSAGDDPPPVVDTPVGRLAGVVCYDLRFGPLLQVPFEEGAELLVVPAQWPAPRAAHWRALCLGRAVEGQLVVVAANRTGVDTVGRAARALAFPGNSLVVDAAGTVVAEGRGESGLVSAEIDLGRQRALRRTVPVGRDRRPGRYAAWRKAFPGIGSG